MIDYSDPDNPCFQGSSPDELTMVNTASELGYKLSKRSSGTILLEIKGKSVTIEVFAVIEFTSARKKMSIIALLPDGDYYIFSKGADSAILERLSFDEKDSPTVAKSLKALESFACQGLRTLCFAYRKLDKDVALEWLDRWSEALNTVTDRQNKIDSVADIIETDLHFIGATGVEDRLQNGVPETVDTLMKANIKVWMLTGDRFETAVSTGFLCNMLQPSMIQLHLLKKSRESIVKSIDNFTDLIDKSLFGTTFALVLNGAAVESILSDSFLKSPDSRKFIQVVKKCRTLLCCRLSPLQKSQIVRFAREHLDWITLAVGDGGNDVSMIQAANVGVGISGNEGMQASRSADFAIGQFKFLVKLVLVHGSWSFHRLSRVVLYSIYKNFALFFCQLWFSFYNGFSATNVYEPWMNINWNLVFTCWPPTIIGLTDQYVFASELIQNPQLYEFGQSNKFYDDKTFWTSAFNGILTSFFIFFFVVLIYPEGMIFESGQVSTALMLGSTIFAIVLNVVSLKVILFTNYLTFLLGALVVLSAAMWYAFIPIMHHFFPGSLPNASTLELFKAPTFWALLLLVPVIVSGRDFLWKFFRRQFRPHPYHIVQELKLAKEPKKQTRTFKEFFNLIFEGENRKPSKNRGFSFSQSYGQSRVLQAYGQSPKLTTRTPTVTEAKLESMGLPGHAGHIDYTNLHMSFRQFSKPANFYFLVVASLQQIPGLSPTGRWGTLVPLILSLIVSAAKELFEDLKRANDDEAINLRKVLSIKQDGQIDSVPLESLKVGQLVKILRDELIPADLVLLQSSEEDGLCYLETATIDGESNLKLRQAHTRTQQSRNWPDGLVTCDPPNCEIYHFQGTLQEPFSNNYNSNNAFPLTLGNNQFLPRGSILVNTEWIVGVIVYTGKDTKIMKNIQESRRKRTKMDKLNDEQTGQIVFLLLVLVTILFTGHVYYNRAILAGKHYYLRLNEFDTVSGMLWSYFSNFITFLLLLNNIVPISLSVTLEIVRSLLAHLIDNDLDMYDEELQIASKARSSNVLDELGRIQYIMTDKTGTLTSNQMTLKHFYCRKTHLNCLDSCITDNGDVDVRTFIQAMALCHTVLIDKRDGTFQASSPDELALIKAAKKLNCAFISQVSDKVTLRQHDNDVKFTQLATIEFTSDRKRMSTILRDESTNRTFIICKGADSVIAEICTDFDAKAVEKVEQFSLEGLRTLCFAGRDIPENEFRLWHEKWLKAQNSFGPERKDLIDSAAKEIECELSFIGISGIEDRLQVGVPQAVSTLLRANIKIWILTGDRGETATNTAYLSRLLKPHHLLVNLLNPLTIAKDLLEIDTSGPGFVPIISGSVFAQIFKDTALMDAFVPIALQARALIACRLSPLQKAQITQFVQDRLNKTTLAIGDGGNDVGMIQMAHVGVGINGLEGSQAARSADFSISKFRFLVKLLLVHGAWSFHRISRVILYTMYKNFILVLCQFWFAFVNGFSAQSAFSSFLLLLYNSVFSLAPPIIIGITDQYVTAPELIKHPQLYQFGQKGKFYNRKAFWQCILNAIIQSVVICFSIKFFLKGAPVLFSNQHGSNLKFAGDLFYFVVLLTVSIKVVLFTNYFTKLMLLALLVALSLCFTVILVNSGGLILKCALSLAMIVLVPIFTLLPDFLWKFYQRQFNPRAYHIVQEMRAVRNRRLGKQQQQQQQNICKSSGSVELESAPLIL